jgi:hypothetical protein
MYYWTPKRIKELKERGYKLRACPEAKVTSSQAKAYKHPNQRTRVQASSQNSQALESQNQGTSAQAHGPGCKQQG